MDPPPASTSLLQVLNLAEGNISLDVQGHTGLFPQPIKSYEVGIAWPILTDIFLHYDEIFRGTKYVFKTYYTKFIIYLVDSVEFDV